MMFGSQNDCSGLTLMVYNENRSFQNTLQYQNNESHFLDLVNKIKCDGVAGVKGYFHAFMGLNKNNQIKINIKRILPNQPW